MASYVGDLNLKLFYFDGSSTLSLKFTVVFDFCGNVSGIFTVEPCLVDTPEICNADTACGPECI